MFVSLPSVTRPRGVCQENMGALIQSLQLSFTGGLLVSGPAQKHTFMFNPLNSPMRSLLLPFISWGNWRVHSQASNVDSRLCIQQSAISEVIQAQLSAHEQKEGTHSSACRNWGVPHRDARVLGFEEYLKVLQRNKEGQKQRPRSMREQDMFRKWWNPFSWAQMRWQEGEGWGDRPWSRWKVCLDHISKVLPAKRGLSPLGIEGVGHWRCLREWETWSDLGLGHWLGGVIDTQQIGQTPSIKVYVMACLSSGYKMMTDTLS